jgi:molybdopterin-containing oxidoreductase family membrane subunit
MYKKSVRGVLIEGNKSYGDITREVLASQETKRAPLWWYGGMFVFSAMFLVGMYEIGRTITEGIGLWGNNNSVAWGWAIINFVWWIGIGHAGTAFSIFLLVLRQKWRTSINRAAEAMTVFAVLAAGIYPMIHMGRIWNAIFIFPYPNTRGLWVNYNSPLFWDVVAISTYLLTSAIFWYIGMIPDLATVRDRSTNKIRKAVYSIASFGWVGSARSWKRFEILAVILGGLAAPLVIAVHSIVSMDFATAVIPGWHTTIFPPYFVVGAIFSGFAMVLTLMIVIRISFKLGDFVTDGHFDAIARILTFVSLIMGSSYMTEVFLAWYSGSEYEGFTFFHNRIFGDYAFQFWAMVIANAVIPQLFWFKKVRRNIVWLFAISIVINIGMWYERFNIVITSTAKDFLPSNWAEYSPSNVEILIYLGTIGLFGVGVLWFIRYIPMMALNELKMVNKETSRDEE